ncbi:MAG: hypothetical protein WBG43_13095 [Marinifilaceae bacterium]
MAKDKEEKEVKVKVRRGAPDNRMKTHYKIDKGRTVKLTLAEKAILDYWVINDVSKTNAWLTVFEDMDKASAYAGQWFRAADRVAYLQWYKSKQAVVVKAQLSDLVIRIGLMCKFTAADTFNQYQGAINVHDLPEEVLAVAEVEHKYAPNGVCIETKLKMPSMSVIMTSIAKLAEVDPTLAEIFRTQLQASKPTLNRSKPKTIENKADDA